MSLLARLARHAEERAGAPALLFETESGDLATWTYERLFAEGHEAAAALTARGVRRGERVAVFLGNRPEMVAGFLALLELGAAMVPINLAYRAREIEHIVEDAVPRLVLTDERHADLVAPVVGEASVMTVEELAGGPAVAMPEEPIELEEPEEPDSPPFGDTTTAMILYTSGTTGKSKGAVMSHGNVRATIEALLEAWSWSPRDVLLLTLPLFHTHGLVVGLLCALAAGATVRLERKFEAESVVATLRGQSPGPRPTLFFGVPTMYVRLVDELRKGGGDLASMRLLCSGSAPLDPETFSEFETLTGQAILERYGMTETGMLLSNPYRGPRRAGTVGRELPGVRARVVGRDGLDLPDGDEGELLVRGDNVFAGYWRDPEKTSASFALDAEGLAWFRTGDLARRDPETGYYTLLGRRHELIISGGFNVYPREVEEVLMTLSGIREVAVVGREHPEWGEQVVAFVVGDESYDRDRILEECRRRMAHFKIPRRLERLESLPRNALGKVQKHLLPD